MTEKVQNLKIALSVVIPCYNAEATLGEQLDALLKEEWNEPWEILVSDNGSADRTRDIAREYVSENSGVRYVDASGRKGPSHARNRGAAEARGTLIAFVDADDVIATGWVAAITQGIRKHSFVASKMDGIRLNGEESEEVKPMRQQTGLMEYRYTPFLPFAGGCGLGVTKALHRKVGGFDEEMLYCEDCDYCWRIQLSGTPLIFWPAAQVHIRNPQNHLGLFRQARNWGEYNAALYKKFLSAGIPPVSLKRGMKLWWRALSRAPRMWRPLERHAFIWYFGYRVGMLKGSIKYRVFAP